MGVNIPNIKEVVIFGEAEIMESYPQEVGMGGRNGSDVLSMNAYHLCLCT